MVNKEVFKRVGTNDSDISAGGLYTVDYIDEAEKNGYLPHTSFVIANQSTEVLYIFLDDVSNQNTPDYVLFPSQQLAVPTEDGVTFRTMFIKNTDGANSVSANEIKHRISTAKEV